MSPGMLLLILALALHSVLSGPGIQRSLSIEEEYMEEEKDETKMQVTHKWFKKNIPKMIELAAIAIGGTPKAGSALNAILRAPLLFIPQADKLDGIRTEMNALNGRLDIFYEELKWASSDYQQTVDNIENAWLKYIEMFENYGTSGDAQERIFFPFYSQYVDSALVLHRLLTKPADNTQSLGDVLAKKLRCHENDVTAQFLYLNQLVCKGNVMDEKYYQFKEISTEGRKTVAQKIANETALALFKSHQKCVSNSELYIKRDILERIDDKKVHQEIADNIGAFLRKTYDRYEWVVVAFTTHFSKNMARFMKRHILSGFSEIERGTVTVAIAGQIKGKYTKANGVKAAIKQCLKDVKCGEVYDKLLNCPNVGEAVTAVHVFTKKNQTSIRAKKVETFEESYVSSDQSQIDHIYTGQCQAFGILKKGNFIILIKSDEEIDGQSDPCKNLQCKNGGQCEVAPRTSIPMCKCTYPFYGKTCENIIEIYKANNYGLSRTKIPVMSDNRRRNNKK